MTLQPGAPAGPTAAPECYRHPGTETHIRCSRCERYICAQCMIPAAVGFHCPACVQQSSAGVRQVRTSFGGILRPRGVPVVTFALIAVNFIVFGLQHLSGGSGIHDLSGSQLDNLELHLDLQSKFWADGHPIGVANGEWYRLFTAMFLHENFWHIASNMVVLYFIGPILETLLGRTRFLLVYIVGGLAGNALSYFFMPAVAAALGASGAIAGVFGCLIVVGLRAKILDPAMIALVLVLNVVTPLANSDIDWRAHLGGFTAGLLMGLTYAFIPEILRALGRPPGARAENARLLNVIQFGTMALILAVAAVLTAVHTSTLNDPANRLRPMFGATAVTAPTGDTAATWHDVGVPESYPQAAPGYPHWG